MTVVPPINLACANCRFWKRLPSQTIHDNPTTGNCQRRAPVMESFDLLQVVGDISEHLTVKKMWPITSAIDWCGEWEKLHDT